MWQGEMWLVAHENIIIKYIKFRFNLDDVSSELVSLIILFTLATRQCAAQNELGLRTKKQTPQPVAAREPSSNKQQPGRNDDDNDKGGVFGDKFKGMTLGGWRRERGE